MLHVAYCSDMGTKTKRAFETVYLDHEKLDLFKQLAKDTRIPRAVLAREAIDDLLVKYKVLKAPKGGKGPT
jgi:Ribbon-helix-helix domain